VLLHLLAQDWDILYFNSIFTTRGKPVSPHLIAIRWTPSAIGYIATPSFAAKVLENARSQWYNAWVDIIFEASTCVRTAATAVVVAVLLAQLLLLAAQHIVISQQASASYRRKNVTFAPSRV
jgi:hypothetical protein